MDEEIVELIQQANGCNKCNGCPLADYSEWEDVCHYTGEELIRIYIEDYEDISIYFQPGCTLKTIEFGSWSFTPEKIDSNELMKNLPQELINNYIKSTL